MSESDDSEIEEATQNFKRSLVSIKIVPKKNTKPRDVLAAAVDRSSRRRGKKKKRREQSPHSISPQLYTGKEKSDTEISPTDISYKSERSVHDAGLKQRRKYQRAKKSVSTRSLAANETRDIGVGISADEAEPQNLCHHCNSLTSMPRLYPQASEYLYDKYDQSAAGAIVPAMPSIVFELEQVPSKKLYYCRWTVYWLLWVMTILLFYLLINRDYYCQFLDANAS